MDEDGGLGDAGGLQIVGGVPEHHLGDGKTKDLIGFLHQFPGLPAALVKRLPHAGELGALTGKNICFAHTVSVR